MALKQMQSGKMIIEKFSLYTLSSLFLSIIMLCRKEGGFVS